MLLVVGATLTIGCNQTSETPLVESQKAETDDAAPGDALSQYNRGVIYAIGDGVPQDHVEAVKWYRLAANQGFALAQANIGAAYFNGQGVPQDYAEAVKWSRLAADQGDALSQFNLGVMYGKGQGVPKDYVEAYAWLSLAAKNGLPQAEEFLAKLAPKD